MCSHITPLQSFTKFIILMHPKEFKKVKNNTGFLTKQSLTNCELFIGIDFSNHARINEIINTHNSFILFPSEGALNLSSTHPKFGKNTKDLAVFLIDSTWACTKKIFTQSTNLQQLQHMSFETSRTSKYEIKVQPQSTYLSTIESTHVVLELLNKWEIENIDSQMLDGFLNPFFKMIEYQKELIANPKSHAVRFRKKALL